MKNIITTREELAAAFEAWLKEYNEKPSEFAAEYGDPKSYGEGCADYLIKKLEDGKTPIPAPAS